MSYAKAQVRGVKKANGGAGVLVESRCIVWSVSEAAASTATVADNNTAGDGADTVVVNLAATNHDAYPQGLPMDAGVKVISGTVEITYTPLD